MDHRDVLQERPAGGEDGILRLTEQFGDLTEARRSIGPSGAPCAALPGSRWSTTSGCRKRGLSTGEVELIRGSG